MKKTTIILAAVGLVAFTACQKNYDADNVRKQTITKTVTVSDEAWTAEPSSKSLYEPGVGIHLTKKEYMTVYYSQGNGTVSYAITAATPDGNGNYSFTHNAISGAENYNYIFLLPHLSKNATASSNTGQKCRISPIQFPTETSFDPNMDYLLGQAQFNVDPQTSVENIKFKRLTAPFKLTVTDSQNVLEGGKINAVTFSLSQEATKYSGLVGTAYLSASDDFDKATIKNLQDKGSGNGVTALYPAGLNKSEDGYAVWYMTAPISIAAGTQLTVSVNAGSKTITRTVTLPQVEILENKLNGVAFDISGEGYTTENSVTWHFSPLEKFSSIATKFIGSDGVTTGWSKSAKNAGIGNDKDANSFIQNAMNCSNKDTGLGYLEFTPANGKTVTKVRLYGSTLAADSKGEMAISADGTQIGGNIKTDFTSMSTTCGYRDVEIPNGSSVIRFAGASNDSSYISAITIFFAE